MPEVGQHGAADANHLGNDASTDVVGLLWVVSHIGIDRNCNVLPIEYDLLIVMFVNINITITIIFFLTNKMSCHQQYVTFQYFACFLFLLFCIVT